MVGLRKISEFKIGREGLGDLVGAGQVHAGDDFLRLKHEFGGRGLLRIAADRFAMLDQQSPQFFHGFEQILPGLLDQYLSKDCPQRADVPTQRVIFYGFVGRRNDFSEARRAGRRLSTAVWAYLRP